MNTNDSPLISVILITYNSARYVVEALESVKAQGCENMEMIVCDDASTDNTVQLCTGWLEKNKDLFPWVKILAATKNEGIPANCNKGLRAATGEWLKILAGDDILLKNAFADNLAYARRFPNAVFIASDVCEIDENGALIREYVPNEGLIILSRQNSAKKQAKSYVRWPAFLNTPTFFFQRDLIDKVGYFDESFRIYEDLPMIIRLFECGHPLHYLKRNTVAYRIHKHAASRSGKLEEIREKEALRVFKEYQSPKLSVFNPFDLSVFFESWLRFKYSAAGLRGGSLLRKLSLYYWYMRMIGVRTY